MPDAKDRDSAAGTGDRRDQSVLSLRGVSYAYRVQRKSRLEVVDRIDLEIARGEFVCVVGPSGCGKTTLLRLMAGFLTPTIGHVLDSGDPVAGPDWRRGMVFQQPNLYPWLTVRKNIEFGPRARGVAKAERDSMVDRCLRMVKLTDYADYRTYELSGGMQQRVALARVLANEPHILLMDEPFGALDALTREHMQEEILAIWRRNRPTVVLVTHSVEEAVYLGTRVLVCSHRPTRIIADLDIPFSRGVDRCIVDPSGSSPSDRSIRSDPRFIELRERVLAYVWE